MPHSTIKDLASKERKCPKFANRPDPANVSEWKQQTVIRGSKVRNFLFSALSSVRSRSDSPKAFSKVNAVVACNRDAYRERLAAAVPEDLRC
jgi:hypothetical protein